jgi:hypothetical protein
VKGAVASIISSWKPSSGLVLERRNYYYRSSIENEPTRRLPVELFTFQGLVQKKVRGNLKGAVASISGSWNTRYFPVPRAYSHIKTTYSWKS